MICWWLGLLHGVAHSGVEFSGARAFSWLERQVALGPRVPGTEGNRQLRELILAHADSLGFVANSVCLEVTDPLSGELVEICNVVVTVAGVGDTGAPHLWLGAHFDTRPVSDQDADPSRRGLPVPGANDGASGTAILLHLMELMGKAAPPSAVRLLFFDGEDSGAPGDASGFCLGSQYLAKTWQSFGNPLAGAMPRGFILLDMVGGRGLQVPMEGYSRQYAPEWTAFVFGRAASLGLDCFVPTSGRSIVDDHIGFLEQGIPAVDLIDFSYPQWHTAADVPEFCAAESLAQVGTLLWDLVQHP